VAPVKNSLNTIQRPMSLLAVCAPPATAVPSVALAVSAAWRQIPAEIPQAQVSQAHQVRVEAALALTLATAAGGYGAPVLRSGSGVDFSNKRMTVGANGVPPRGRPV
jgi:hypothetical protein